MSSTVLDAEDIAVNKTKQNSYRDGAYILLGGDKHKSESTVC